MSGRITLQKKISTAVLFFLFIILYSTQTAQDGIIVVDETSNQRMALGKFDRSVFLDSGFVDWFTNEYDLYSADENILQVIKGQLDGLHIKIVMGTWCSDSRREVPRFYKILDALRFDEQNIDLICVDRAKVGLSDEVDGLNINFVPTFIFYINEIEVGRIIETPDVTLEMDFESILK